MENEYWRGYGFCKARSIQEADDYCNKQVVKGGEYCDECTCVDGRCNEQASSWFPLLPGTPRFCSEHYKTHRHKYGCG